MQACLVCKQETMLLASELLFESRNSYTIKLTNQPVSTNPFGYDCSAAHRICGSVFGFLSQDRDNVDTVKPVSICTLR